MTSLANSVTRRFLLALVALFFAATSHAAPVVTLTASPASIAYGGNTSLAWAAADASYCGLPWGSSATAGTYTTPALFSATTYTITCYGTGGSQSASVTVSVSGPPPAPTVSLTADPATLPSGATSNLSWASTNARSCNTPWGSSATSGIYTTPPVTYEQTFTVTCSGYGGSNAAFVVVRLGAAGAPPPPTVLLTANPTAIAYGATSTLSWSSTNASSCVTPWGSSATAGSYITPALTVNTSYSLSCTGAGGSQTASVTVTVAAAPPGGSGVSVSLTATPASIAYGATSTLAWTSANTTYCSLPWGSSVTSGSYVTPGLFANTTYTITCYGPSGSKSASVTVSVSGPPPAPTVTLTANPVLVLYNTSSTLSWASTNANSCNTPWGSTAISGVYVTPPITYERTFTVTCSGYGGSNAASVTVKTRVANPPAPTVTLTANPASIAYNATTVLNWASTGASSCITPWGSTAISGSYAVALTASTSYTVTCAGPGGFQSASASVTVTVAPPPTLPAPTVTLTANPAAVAYNGISSLTWASTNATACTTPWGSTAASGGYTTPPLTSTTAYSVTCVGAGGSATASATVTVAPPVADVNPPIIFNATASARAGDVISLQGDNFGDAPVAYLESAPSAALEIVNRVASNWVAVRLPATAQGALVLRLRNATGTSAAVKLNAAKPLHLDAVQLVPGGAFKIFGRNLLLPGSAPSVTLDGIATSLDLARSDEHMLVATVPATLNSTASVTIVVDNGNGSGSATLDRSIEVVTSGTGDAFALGVGWAAAFSDLATRTIDTVSDPRLSQRVVCDGVRDDSPAIAQAIQLAASIGGGVVRLPPGRCRVAGGMNMQSKVVVQGAGKAATELVYQSNYPVFGVGLDLVGIRNLTLTNSGSAVEGPLLKQSTRVFLQNVGVNTGRSSQMFLDGNRNFVITGSDFVQTGSLSHQGPYILNDAAGLVFEGNTTRWVEGAPAFGRIHDSYVHNNRFSRDGSAQNLTGTVHSFTIDFAYRIAVVGNTFDVVNGPITNTLRNDGETILTEGGGAVRTENLGTVGSATSDTLTDASNTLLADPFGTGYVPENYGIAIVGGKGAGQTRRMVTYTWPTASIERPWDVIPDSTSRYASFVWGLEKSLIKNNTLSQNPRGIWLYQTALRDVDVLGNNISEGGGIYLRSYQNLGSKIFTPIYNVLIAQNKISNTTGRWMSYLNAVFVNSDARAFGIAMLGIEMRSNQITANVPNVESQTEEYANIEGFMNMMRVENFNGYESSVVPRLLGTVLTNNSCTNCNVAVRIGTGAGGTTILNTQLLNCPVLLQDWATTVTGEKSTGTVVQ